MWPMGAAMLYAREEARDGVEHHNHVATHLHDALGAPDHEPDSGWLSAGMFERQSDHIALMERCMSGDLPGRPSTSRQMRRTSGLLTDGLADLLEMGGLAGLGRRRCAALTLADGALMMPDARLVIEPCRAHLERLVGTDGRGRKTWGA